MSIKPFLELGPDVEDYYKPSSPHVSQEEQMQERCDYQGPIANKLLTLMKGTEHATWFSTTPEIYSDGCEMLKQLMRHNIPALKSKDAQTVHAITTTKPVYKNNVTISIFHSKYIIWLQVEK